MNVGKKFEQAFKNSVPNDCLYYRMKDSVGSFSDGNNLRFSLKQPCDCLVFDCNNTILYFFELKSTGGTSFSFDDIHSNDKTKRMIHKHQILGLMDFAKYNNVIAGIVFNFRKPNSETTYFQEIDDFLKMTYGINKISINESDLKRNNAIEIIGNRKKVNYKWDLKGLLEKESELYVKKNN